MSLIASTSIIAESCQDLYAVMNCTYLLLAMCQGKEWLVHGETQPYVGNGVKRQASSKANSHRPLCVGYSRVRRTNTGTIAIMKKNIGLPPPPPPPPPPGNTEFQDR